jgi:hypothetical protein
MLLDLHDHPFVFSTPEGRPWRRSNFRQRWWRPAWDGRGTVSDDDHLPVVLPWFTFHEGRHTHSTWMAADGIPEVARRARHGQKMKGIARVYDHVTPDMEQTILDGLEARWVAGLTALTEAEQDRLIGWFPHVKQTLINLDSRAQADGAADGKKPVRSIFAPSTH